MKTYNGCGDINTHIPETKTFNDKNKNIANKRHIEYENRYAGDIDPVTVNIANRLLFWPPET